MKSTVLRTNLTISINVDNKIWITIITMSGKFIQWFWWLEGECKNGAVITAGEYESMWVFIIRGHTRYTRHITGMATHTVAFVISTVVTENIKRVVHSLLYEKKTLTLSLIWQSIYVRETVNRFPQLQQTTFKTDKRRNGSNWKKLCLLQICLMWERVNFE